MVEWVPIVLVVVIVVLVVASPKPTGVEEQKLHVLVAVCGEDRGIEDAKKHVEQIWVINMGVSVAEEGGYHCIELWCVLYMCDFPERKKGKKTTYGQILRKTTTQRETCPGSHLVHPWLLLQLFSPHW